MGRIDPAKGIPLLLHARADACGPDGDWHLNVPGLREKNEFARIVVTALRDAWSSRTQWRQLGRSAAKSARVKYWPDDFLRVIASPMFASSTP